MTHTEILEKAIAKAVENGWGKKDYLYGNAVMLDYPAPEKMIFDHGFARAFWGDKEKTGYLTEGKEGWETVREWQYHLQLMVVVEDRIKYLEKFI